MKRLLKFILLTTGLLLIINIIAFNSKVLAVPQITSIKQYKAKINGIINGSINFMTMIYDGKRYIAASDKGVILQSNDAITWNVILNNINVSLNSMAFNKIRYVVVGNKGKVLFSTDAKTWSSAKSGTNEDLSKVIWNGKQFEAVGGYGAFITSSDGITWNAENLNNYIITDIASNGNQDILFAWNDTSFLLSSKDQKHWIGSSIEGTKTDALDDLGSIGFINNKYVFFAKSEDSNFEYTLKIFTSIDGKEWDESDYSMLSSEFEYLGEVLFKNGIIFYKGDEYNKTLEIMFTKNNIDVASKKLKFDNEVNGGIFDNKGIILFADNADMIRIQTKYNNSNGFGKTYYSNGKIEYAGNWKADERCGNGKLYSQDGKLIYDGMFEHSMRNGKGKSYINGKLDYNGNWSCNQKAGYGISYYKNSIKAYEGAWKNNEKSGYGKMYAQNGNILYEGNFENNLYDGQGKLYNNKKLQYEGQFVFGVKDGTGKFFSPTGTLVYEGEFHNNQVNGIGKLYDNKGKLIGEKKFIDGRDSEGFDIYGYDKMAYNREGFDSKGYNKQGFNRSGYSINGYSKEGISKPGIATYGNSIGNINNGGIGIRQGQWIYINADFPIKKNVLPSHDKGNLYKVKIDGSEKQKLSEKSALYINIAGEWIYFCSNSDNHSIYRIKTDGSSEKKISNVEAYNMNIVGNLIYYINAKDKSIYKMKLDGSNITKLGGKGVVEFNVVGTEIFYSKENLGIFKLNSNNISAKIVKADLNIIKESVKEFIVQKQSIYFINNNGEFKTYRLASGAKSKSTIIAKNVSRINIDSNYIYYIKVEHQDYTNREDVYNCEVDYLWKADINGKKPELISNASTNDQGYLSDDVYIYDINIIDGLPYINFEINSYYTNAGGQIVEGQMITNSGCIRVEKDGENRDVIKDWNQ